MDPFFRNALLNTANGIISGAQDSKLGWAIAAATVSAFSLSSTAGDQRTIPASVQEAKDRAILPMFLLGMAGWYAGRKLFPPLPPAVRETVTPDPDPGPPAPTTPPATPTP